MQISATTPIQPIIDRTTTTAHAQVKPVEVAKPKPLAPEPPIRPDVQDTVDIDRTLIALRQS